MKKLLSLFAISSIVLTGTGNLVACGNAIDKNKERDLTPDRVFGTLYKFQPSAGTSWPAGSTSDFVVQFSSGAPLGLFLENTDKIEVHFKLVSGTDVQYNNNSITLGTAWHPAVGDTFQIIFSNSSMEIKDSVQPTSEIDIKVIS